MTGKSTSNTKFIKLAIGYTQHFEIENIPDIPSNLWLTAGITKSKPSRVCVLEQVRVIIEVS